MGMQEAMRAAEKKSTEECPVKMKLVAPPLYVLTTNVSHTLLPQKLATDATHQCGLNASARLDFSSTSSCSTC